MQEIVLILSSLAGVATAAAVHKIPRNKHQLLSLGASSHIKSQVSSLKIEKDILTRTISRLYQTESEFAKIQKDKLLLKYQHQLGIVLAKLEKLEQASRHPDLGPVGDGLITLMDQKLSKLDDRLYEISSKITSGAETVTEKMEVPKAKIPEAKQETAQKSNMFNFEKSKEDRIKPVEVPPTKSRQSFELTTLTNVPRKEPKFPLFEVKEEEDKSRPIIKPMPEPRIIQTELIRTKQDIVNEITQTKPKIEDKMEIIQSIDSKPESVVGTRPDLSKEVARISEHKALPGPVSEYDGVDFEDDSDDADDLEKIKRDIAKVLTKLNEADVE